MSRTLAATVAGYLEQLTTFPDRHVGGPGNRAATALFADHVERCGLDLHRRQFPCIEWDYGRGELVAGGIHFDTHVGPYSLPCDVTAELRAAAVVEELELDDLSGKVVLLHGELAAHQVMPKSFRFYNPESHQRIVRALEAKAPAALVAATGTDPEMVGSQYPFPLFEDGDLDIPNAYLKDVDGQRLAALQGQPVRLTLDSRRVPTTAEHLVARAPGTGPNRIVITAHIDSRKDSPGALDNASGVAVLMALAEWLPHYRGGPTIELVPFNGEDNYATPGELLWIEENEGRFDEILLAINIDDLGLKATTNHLSFYGCPAPLEAAVRAVMAAHPLFEVGPQWAQGDHMIMSLYDRPAIALASSDLLGFMRSYAHTERDTVEIADPELIADAVIFLRALVDRLGTFGPPQG